jgi:hypothetical protein
MTNEEAGKRATRAAGALRRFADRLEEAAAVKRGTLRAVEDAMEGGLAPAWKALEPIALARREREWRAGQRKRAAPKAVRS